MLMPGRKYSSDKYRYGFNGKENDNEVKGDGNQQDYGMRVYDGRIGKFLSIDPITKKYPELTSFQFSSLRPIDGIDLDGMEYYNVNDSKIAIGLQFDPMLKKITSFSTYYVFSRIPDKMKDLINQSNKCTNCIGSSAAQVVNFYLPFTHPFVIPQSAAEASDIDLEENSAVGPSNSGTQIRIIPKNNAERIRQEKDKKYFTEGASPRIGKANAILAGIDVFSKLVVFYGDSHIDDITTTSKNQSFNAVPRVIAMIQMAIDDNLLKNHTDQASLVKIANYLLNGEPITNLVEVNGDVRTQKDTELTKLADNIWKNYYLPLPINQHDSSKDCNLKKDKNNVKKKE